VYRSPCAICANLLKSKIISTYEVQKDDRFQINMLSGLQVEKTKKSFEEQHHGP
jgi:hypothetical protein